LSGGRVNLNKESTVKKANTVCAIIAMAISLLAFIKTFGFKQFKNIPIGPEFFPRYLACGLFICSVALLLQARRADPIADKPAPPISLKNKGMQRLLAGIAIIIVYALSWEVLGFVIATPLALFALMFLLGLRRYLLMLIFSLGAMVVIFGAFRYFLNIDMPLGFLDGMM
jgi:putative tricarboxylic transport membrane protein